MTSRFAARQHAASLRPAAPGCACQHGASRLASTHRPAASACQHGASPGFARLGAFSAFPFRSRPGAHEAPLTGRLGMPLTVADRDDLLTRRRSRRADKPPSEARRRAEEAPSEARRRADKAPGGALLLQTAEPVALDGEFNGTVSVGHQRYGAARRTAGVEQVAVSLRSWLG